MPYGDTSRTCTNLSKKPFGASFERS